SPTAAIASTRTASPASSSISNARRGRTDAMNAETELARALVANVGEIAVAAHRLHAVLKDESAVLASADDAALLELTGIKTQLLQQLEVLESERMHLIGELRTGAVSGCFAGVGRRRRNAEGMPRVERSERHGRRASPAPGAPGARIAHGG